MVDIDGDVVVIVVVNEDRTYGVNVFSDIVVKPN